jgi:hypothetical protein
VLANVIKEVKKAYYDSTILTSHNKIKATSSVIKRETGHKTQNGKPQLLKICYAMIKNKEQVANVFNE